MSQIHKLGVKEAFDRGIIEVGFGQDTGLEPCIHLHHCVSLNKLLNSLKPHFHHL